MSKTDNREITDLERQAMTTADDEALYRDTWWWFSRATTGAGLSLGQCQWRYVAERVRFLLGYVGRLHWELVQARDELAHLRREAKRKA